MPGLAATLEAVAIGLFIPIISAVVPIQRALSKTLSESLNTARSTLSGTVVIVEDKSVRMIPFLVFGSLCVIAGTTIYIILPQALLAENAGLILQIFFLILIGMILGLTLISANLRGFVEILVTYALFWWEKKSMRSLIKKNLVAHKRTNKLTSIIYALTIGVVIFLCVALNLVIRLTQTTGEGSYSTADIVVTSTARGTNGFFASNFYHVLKANELVIKDFGYVSYAAEVLEYRTIPFYPFPLPAYFESFNTSR